MNKNWEDIRARILTATAFLMLTVLMQQLREGPQGKKGQGAPNPNTQHSNLPRSRLMSMTTTVLRWPR